MKEFIHYPLTSKVDYEKIVPQLKQIVNCAVVNKSINPGDLKVLL